MCLFKIENTFKISSSLNKFNERFAHVILFLMFALSLACDVSSVIFYLQLTPPILTPHLASKIKPNLSLELILQERNSDETLVVTSM